MTDEPVLLAESRWSLFRSAVFMAVLGCAALWAGVWLFQLREPNSVVLALAVFPCSLFLLAGSLWCLHRLIWLRHIELRPAGLLMPGWKASVPWSAFSPFTVVYRRMTYNWLAGCWCLVDRRSPPGKAYALWAVKPGVPPPGAVRYAGYISHTFPYEPDKLVATLEWWRLKYTDRP